MAVAAMLSVILAAAPAYAGLQTGSAGSGQAPQAAQRPAQQLPPAREAQREAPVAERPLSVTRHTVTIEGKPVPYTATAGELVILKQNEAPGAAMFFVAYTRDDVRDRASRPVTFCFNGGPGSSTVWLHLGGLGPKRVAMDDEGRPTDPPYGLVDSEFSILDITDLVFVDAVSTGFSRPLPGEEKSQFHGVQEDAAAFAEFIRTYLNRFERWESPKYLLGESYGTTRAAALSGVLQGRTYGIFLNGIVLVSSVLDFGTLTFSPGNPLAYILFLPHYTATAWYHKRLPADLQSRPLSEVLIQAREFALKEYAPALLKGNLLDPAAYENMALRTAAFTGLSVDYVKRANLRVRHDRFVKELLRDRRLTVGRLDSRFTGADADAAGESYEFDPSSSLIMGAFATRLNHYVGAALKFRKDIPYAVYGNVYPWNYSLQPSLSEPGRPSQQAAAASSSRQAPLNVAETLRRAMAENAGLRVFSANGFYDGATPFFATEYTFSQMGIGGEFKPRVVFGHYEAGHMMYIHKPSLRQLKRDLATFIR
jgi:carboxypeptidase C (cathepsin A)